MKILRPWHPMQTPSFFGINWEATSCLCKGNIQLLSFSSSFSFVCRFFLLVFCLFLICLVKNCSLALIGKPQAVTAREIYNCYLFFLFFICLYVCSCLFVKASCLKYFAINSALDCGSANFLLFESLVFVIK